MNGALFEIEEGRIARAEEFCPVCHGRGFVRRDNAREDFCSSCKGSGRILRARIVPERQQDLFQA